MKKSEPKLSEADRFQEFARRLVSVPKSEIDEREAAYQWEKKQRKLRRKHVTEKN